MTIHLVRSPGERTKEKRRVQRGPKLSLRNTNLNPIASAPNSEMGTQSPSQRKAALALVHENGDSKYPANEERQESANTVKTK